MKLFTSFFRSIDTRATTRVVNQSALAAGVIAASLQSGCGVDTCDQAQEMKDVTALANLELRCAGGVETRVEGDVCSANTLQAACKGSNDFQTYERWEANGRSVGWARKAVGSTTSEMEEAAKREVTAAAGTKFQCEPQTLAIHTSRVGGRACGVYDVTCLGKDGEYRTGKFAFNHAHNEWDLTWPPYAPACR